MNESNCLCRQIRTHLENQKSQVKSGVNMHNPLRKSITVLEFWINDQIRLAGSEF